MASTETFVEVVNMLEAAYPRANFNDNTLKLFALTLSDVNDKDLKTAVISHISNSKWPPTVAELRACIPMPRHDIDSRRNGRDFHVWHMGVSAQWAVCPTCEEHTPNVENCPFCQDISDEWSRIYEEFPHLQAEYIPLEATQ